MGSWAVLRVLVVHNRASGKSVPARHMMQPPHLQQNPSDAAGPRPGSPFILSFFLRIFLSFSLRSFEGLAHLISFAWTPLPLTSHVLLLGPPSLLQGAVLRYFAHLPWSPQRHHLWPPAFRLQARELLLCAHRRPAQQGAGAAAAAGLWALPREVVVHILEALGGSRTDWMR